MRSKAGCFFLLWLALTPMGSAFAQGGTKRIAVYDFDDSAIRSEVLDVYGSQKKIGAQVAHRIIADLVNSSAFDVIDREQIDRIMHEQNLKFSPRFDPKDAPKLGKLLNVDAIVTGTVEELSAEVNNNKFSVLHVGIGKAEAQAQVNVSARVIGTETGRIFLSDTVDATSKQGRGIGASFADKGGSSSDSDSAHPRANAVTMAVNHAASELAARIVEKASSMPSRQAKTSPVLMASNTSSSGIASGSRPSAPPRQVSAPPAPAELLVGRVEGRKVYITGGTNAGLKVNQLIEIRRPTGTMSDGNGGVIQIDEKVETLLVTEVEERYAIAQAQRAATPLAQVNDKVRPLKTSRPAETAHR
jgi:curli biogenesis system outer membrane secretion channel CsgG